MPQIPVAMIAAPLKDSGKRGLLLGRTVRIRANDQARTAGGASTGWRRIAQPNDRHGGKSSAMLMLRPVGVI